MKLYFYILGFILLVFAAIFYFAGDINSTIGYLLAGVSSYILGYLLKRNK